MSPVVVKTKDGGQACVWPPSSGESVALQLRTRVGHDLVYFDPSELDELIRALAAARVTIHPPQHGVRQ